MSRPTLLAALLVLLTAPALQAEPNQPVAADPNVRQIGQLVLEGAPPLDDAVRRRMLQYLSARSAGLADIADDGAAVLISTRFGDTQQLHLVREPLGMRRQLTFFDEPVGGGFFVPGSDGRQLIYTKDFGGNEVDQYYLFDVGSARSTLLTDGRSRHGGLTVTRDGALLGYTSTARNGRDYDVYLRPLVGGEPRLLWRTDGAFYVGEFNPAGDKLLVLQYLSAAHTKWFMLDVADGAPTELTPPDEQAYYGGGAWSADGKHIYFTSDAGGDFRKLYRYELSTQTFAPLTDDIDWNVIDLAVEPTGAGLAFVVNEDGVDRLYFARPDGSQRRRIDLPLGRVGGLRFALAGGKLGVTLNTPRTPSDVHVLTFPEGVAERWTASEVGGMDTSKFVEPKLIRYPTFDEVDGRRRMIPAFYYPAPQPGPRPVVIYAHGGPEGQFRPTFISTFQYWALELGVSVIAPNVRGSTGYGRAFHQLDNGRLREDSVRDVGALLDWIADQPELDADRVGIYGGSYGGYMVLASLAMYPDRFKAGIDVVGVANFVTFLENTGDYRRDLRRVEYGDERDPQMRAFLEQISPTNRADRIKAALFVVHGKNDPRVPYTEAEQIVRELRRLDRPVWYALALNEGHGFAKKENSDMARQLYVMFWQEHLLK